MRIKKAGEPFKILLSELEEALCSLAEIDEMV